MGKRAKSIMIQGTASNAGKSWLCAGLCRIFAQDGYRVAPFKSQNMALNSFVTKAGLEMGRAQVVQAECAGVEPDVRMNPILLKPTSDSGSQVILNGEVLGNLQAGDYYTRKGDLIEPVLEAYESLAREFDILVLEGAGSPAEINLKDRDIVNMGLARMTGSPVLLAGDIDRGGVFAALAGTHLLFEPWERDLLKGVVINKFRGDVGLLEPGLHMLEELVGKPVLGVVPWLQVDIDDEDSLSSRFQETGGDPQVEVGVIRLPHISNFTDFNAISAVPGAGVRYISRAEELGTPDLLILPGTKSTIGDLLWLRQSGLEAGIKKYAAAGGPVLGICGGYQMLGQYIGDPGGVEGGGAVEGMGLLPIRTEFHEAKTRRQVTGRIRKAKGCFSRLDEREVRGYEIHMGVTTLLPGTEPLLEITPDSGEAYPDGAYLENICGCYLHGIFDSGAIAGTMVQELAEIKGIALESDRIIDRTTYKEEQYDLLADGLRKALNLPAIYQIIEKGAGE